MCMCFIVEGPPCDGVQLHSIHMHARMHAQHLFKRLPVDHVVFIPPCDAPANEVPKFRFVVLEGKHIGEHEA